MRRDGSAVYRNEGGPEGRWGVAAWAAAVLDSERRRPYTAVEAAQFLAVQRLLLRELPRYRAEILQITQLAQPFLPEDVRVRPLAKATGPAALPVLAAR